MLSVDELMRHDIPVVPPDTSVRRIIELMVDTGVESILIANARGRVIGTIGDEQLVASLHASRRRPWWRQLMADGDTTGTEERLESLVASEVMLRRVVAVVPTTSAIVAIRLFDEYGVNVLPVVAPRGELVGAVYRADLVRRLARPSPFAGRAEG